MISKKLRSWLVAGTCLTAVATAPSAFAQDAAQPNPFLENTVVMSQAFGLEMVGIRLAILEALEPPLDAELIEVVETMAKGDWERFGGTLAEVDADFAADFHEVLSYFEDAMEDGEDVRPLIAQAREMLATAYDMVIDPAMQETDAFKGGVAAQLLLAEGGVAEGYEEAAEEIWAFSMGWSSWQRVKEIWADISGEETAVRLDEANQLIGIIDALYPEAMPPMPFTGRNPEEAESPAQLLMGLFEEAAGASLYSGRDLAVLATRLQEVVGAGCEAYTAGNDDVGRESIWAALDHYAGETTGMADLLDLFAPEVNEDIEAYFGMLVVAEEEEEEEEEVAAPGAAATMEEEEEEEMELLPPAEACLALEEELGEARTALGG